MSTARGIGILAVLLAASLAGAEEAPNAGKLAEQLAAPELPVRREAAHRLSELGPGAKAAVPALIRALSDPDRQVWSDSLTAIAALGPEAADAIPTLIDALAGRGNLGFRGRGGGQVVMRSAYALSKIGPAAVPSLIEVLKSGDPGSRAAAARAVGGIGSGAKDAVPGLIANLRRASPDETREIAEALAAIGGASLAPLATALGDADAATRAGAALALAQCGPAAHSLAPRVAEIAAKEQNPAARVALFSAIAKVGVEPARGVPILLAGLKDADDAVRHGATNAIYVYRTAQAPLIAALTTLLRDPNPAVSERAAALLGRFGAAANPAVDTLLEVARRRNPVPPVYYEALASFGAGAIPGILRAVAQEDADAITRDHWSVRCLPAIGGAAVTPLAGALRDGKVSIRLLAARALGELGPVAAPVFAELNVATEDADPRVRAAALGALVATRAQTGAAVAKVGAGLKDPSPAVRVAAAQLVGILGMRARSAAPALLEALGDRDDAVRAAAVEALSAIGSDAEPAVPRLLAVLPSSDAATRAKILAVFAGIGPRAREVLPEVGKQLQNPDAAVRAAALRALGKIDDPAARLPVMRRALDDPDPAVRRAAADELGTLGAAASEAADRLTALLSSATERDVAFAALQKIEVRSVPALITMLSDRDLSVRIFACQRLRDPQVEARAAIPALQALIARPDEREEVRQSARESLKRIDPGP